EGSDVRARMIEYGKLFDELHIVIFSQGGQRERVQLSTNTFVYPTASRSKFFYVRDAVRIGAGIVASGGFVITTQDPFETGLVGMRLSKRFNVPLHVQIHTDFLSPYFVHGILNHVRLAVSKKVLGQARAIRTVSERIRASLAPELRAKASVLPIFSDIEAIKRTPILPDANLRTKYPQFRRIVLVASRLSKEKDIRTAITAFTRAAKDHPHTGLIIVGDGPEKQKLEHFAKKLGGRVEFEPWADHARLISYMKTCDVFLLTSLYEGYGLSMPEAHAAGTTLVATAVGIAGELARETCAPRDASCIALTLGKALGGAFKNRPYAYPYASKQAYLEAYKRDISRALE
ncbi:MAG: glycosyltransferase, partial [Patescibacteria group bacterium]|nr:glycosyltransferase [Patescibacteria group bacterium]